MADDISVVSRAAAWGSWRRSGSSPSNIPTVNNRNLLKQVSDSKGKKRKTDQLGADSNGQLYTGIDPLDNIMQGPKFWIKNSPLDKDEDPGPLIVVFTSDNSDQDDDEDKDNDEGKDDNEEKDDDGHEDNDEEGIDDEDEDDKWLSDGKLYDESAFDADPLFPPIATFSGFVKHIQQLNPKIESRYLLDKIARHSFIRCHKIIQSRIGHEVAVEAGSCMSGPKCRASNNSDFHTSSLGGSLQHEDFPHAAPMPSAGSLPAKFECPLCFRVCEFLEPSDWTRHVYEDVQPFTCTFPNCQVTTPFGQEADWALHENEQHRHLEFWICNIKDCTEKFFDVESFFTHLVFEHRIRNPKTRHAKMRSCHHYTSNKPQDEPCKFCGKRFTDWKNLIIHLANHMKRISLPALSVVCPQQTNESRIIGLVEPVSQLSTVSPRPQERSFRSGDSTYLSQMAQSSNQHISPAIDRPDPNVYRNAKSYPKPNLRNQGMDFATATQSGTGSRDFPLRDICTDDSDGDIWDWGTKDPALVKEQWRTPLPADLPSKDTVVEIHEKPSADHRFNTLGKASPYSSKSQDVESESTYETETDTNEEDWQSARSPFDSILLYDVNERKKALFVETLSAFWNIYNKQYLLILSKYTKSMTICATNGPGSDSIAQSQSTSSAAAASSVTNSLNAPTKRKNSDDEDHPPHDDRSQGPKQPHEHSTPAAKDQPLFRFACPFRKHNPQKYNMHHPGWKCCAISSFESVPRTKEHLYRKHKAAIQCVRCWIFFKNQDDLNTHLSAVNICDVRSGQPIEGITPDMLSKLKSRRRSARDESEEDRWRKMYRMLFPHDEMPSPFFEPVLDDLAQFNESTILPIDEFMRQQLPQFFSRRLEVEILNMDWDDDSGPSDNRGLVRDLFATLVPRLFDEAVGDVVSAYRQRSLLPTPPASLSFDSFQTPVRACSHTASYASSQPVNDSITTLHLANLQPSQRPQYLYPPVTNSELTITHMDRGTPVGSSVFDLSTESNGAPISPNAILQPSTPMAITGDDILSQVEHAANFQEQYPLPGCQSPFNWGLAFHDIYDDSQGDIQEEA